LELCWRFEFEVWGWRVVALGEWEEGSGEREQTRDDGGGGGGGQNRRSSPAALTAPALIRMPTMSAWPLAQAMCRAVCVLFCFVWLVGWGRVTA